MKLHQMYSPLTASPFHSDITHVEILPCKPLQPYIKCFWGSRQPYMEDSVKGKGVSIIIPDTCMDIIFNLDHSNGSTWSIFCGIDEKPYSIHNNFSKRLVSTFGIRFLPWSTILFAEDSIKDTRNNTVDVEAYFSRLKKEIEPLLFETVKIEERIAVVEKYLLKNMHLERMNDTMMNALELILKQKGNIDIARLSKDVHMSNRQLQRIFAENTGITPKKLAALIRYQNVWHESVFHSEFHVLDAVTKYGYTDQSHLLKDFKKFHSMTIKDATIYAKKHVAFLQENNLHR